ncbi:MAG: tol-pal system protein YbgF [Proteobacteria bacterium]|nr:tol-pal system protein YbgF [Pseudomonadota bacterium]
MKKKLLSNVALKIVLVVVLVGVLSASASARELSIQQRLANLEKLVEQQPKNRNSSADIVLQNQVLQQQIAELKGVIEEQNHEIKNLKEKQKLLYIDLDSRLTDIESKSQSASNQSSSQSSKTNNTPQVPLTVEVDENYGATDVSTAVMDIQEPVLSSYQDEYDIAFAHLRAGRFLVSARAFEDFVEKYPNNELTDNSYYWLGESYYVKRQYPQALAAFQTLTNRFPSSDKAPDSWLKIGYSYFEMDDLVKAEENLQKVIDTYPGSSIARLAKNRLLQLHRDN